MFFARICLTMLISISIAQPACAQNPCETPVLDDILLSFLKPIKFTRTGIQCFFKHRFNNSFYAKNFLSCCLDDLNCFLERAHGMEFPRTYCESVIDLFHQRLKESSWINPYALFLFLERVPEPLGPVFNENLLAQQTAIARCLRTALLNKFDQLKQEPDLFISSVSEEIFMVTNSNGEETSVRELQHCLHRFLECALNKIIWDPREGTETWECFKAIAESLETLRNYGILNDTKSLNQLYWSLLYRFCYFIECAGSEIPLQTYKLMNEEAPLLMWLTLEEQEDFIMSKGERLKKALAEGEAKARARAHGILSDVVL